MNIFICERFINKTIVNTTGDYNICKGLLLLEKKFDNFKCMDDSEFLDNNLHIYTNITKYFNSEINSVTIIQTVKIPFLKDYPIKVKQYRYIVDVHGWDMNIFPSNLLLPYAYCYNIYGYNPNSNLYFFPHCVKYNINFNKNPVNKILVSGRGRKNPNRYPMRVFMYELSLKNGFHA